VTHKNTDWLFNSWLYSSTDWALADRIDRFRVITDSGWVGKSDAVEHEVKQLKGEQARRKAAAQLSDCYCRQLITNKQVGSYRYELTDTQLLTKWGKWYLTTDTVALINQFVKFINRLDQQSTVYLIDKLPDSVLDPIIMIAIEAQDNQYLVGDKAIGD
jgi:hypothetical protein